MTTEPSDPIVTVRHLRACRMCARGARRWFAARGLSWSRFATEGYPASVLEATNDALAARVAAAARAEARAP